MTPASPVIPGVAETRFGEGQPQYEVLPAIRLGGAEGQVLTRWKLSDDDRARLAAGGSVYISLYTFDRPLQPIAVFTEPPSIAQLTEDGVRILRGGE